MTESVQIQIEAVDAASGILRGIAGQLGEFGRAGEGLVNVFSAQKNASDLFTRSLTDSTIPIADLRRAQEQSTAATARFAEQITVLAIKLGKDAIDATVKYNGEIHNLSLMSGESMESSSRLVQVLDDFKVSTSQLTPIIKAMTAQGLTPNIETMARLSDQYVAIQDPVAKNVFLFKNFGRAGDDLAQAMSVGGKRLREMSEAVNENLIATEAGWRSTEEYRLALDDMNDTLEGAKMAFGSVAIEPFTFSMQVLTKQIDDSSQSWVSYIANMIPVVALYNLVTNSAEVNTEAEEKLTEATTQQKDALDNLNPSIQLSAEEQKELTAQINATTEANKGQLGLIQQIQRENDTYAASLDELKTKQSELRKEIEKAKASGDIAHVKELTAKYDETTRAVDELERKHADAMKSIVYDLYIAKLSVGGLSDEEFQAALEIGKSLGLIDQATIDTAKAFDKQATDMVAANGKIVTSTSKVEDGINKIKSASSTTASSVISNTGTMEGGFIKVEGAVKDAKKATDNFAGTYAVDVQYTTTYINVGEPPPIPPTCFVRGTLVLMVDGTHKPIEEVRVGDFVKSYNTNTGEFVAAEISKTFEHDAELYFLVNNIGVTPEHVVYANDKWVLVNDLNLGDLLLSETEEYILINNIKIRNESVRVYNLHTSHETHNYFAGGALAHNAPAKDAVPRGKLRTQESIDSGRGGGGFDYERFAIVLRDVMLQVQK